MKKVFVIDCHPAKESFSQGLFEHYIKGAEEAGHEVKSMRLSDMQFELDLASHTEDTALELCLLEFQENIKWCEHVVFVYPLWWGFMPAKTKALIDRSFLPQFAYAYDGKVALPKKLLGGRSAEILVTSDTPKWYFKWLYGAGAFKIARMQIFEFVGFKPVKQHMFSQMRHSSDEMRRRWLDKAKQLGNNIR